MNTTIKNIKKNKQDEDDLRLIRRMKQIADKGFDVEFRKAANGGYKALRVDKKIIEVG